METRPDRAPERLGMLPIVLIGMVMATLLFGGLHLLAKTHAAWETRYADRPAPTTLNDEPTKSHAWTAEDDAEYFRLKAEAAERRRRYDDRLKNTRCIDGVLFKIEGNTYSNVGRC